MDGRREERELTSLCPAVVEISRSLLTCFKSGLSCRMSEEWQGGKSQLLRCDVYFGPFSIRGSVKRLVCGLENFITALA